MRTTRARKNAGTGKFPRGQLSAREDKVACSHFSWIHSACQSSQVKSCGLALTPRGVQGPVLMAT